MVVVLPAPLGPSRPKISPGCTVEVDAVDGVRLTEAVVQVAAPHRGRVRHGFPPGRSSRSASSSRRSAGSAAAMVARSPGAARSSARSNCAARASRQAAMRRSPAVGEREPRRPPVGRVGLAAQQPGLGERVHQRADRVAREVQLVGGRRHPDAGRAGRPRRAARPAPPVTPRRASSRRSAGGRPGAVRRPYGPVRRPGRRRACPEDSSVSEVNANEAGCAVSRAVARSGVTCGPTGEVAGRWPGGIA